MDRIAEAKTFWNHIHEKFADELCLGFANDHVRNADYRSGAEDAGFRMIGQMDEEQVENLVKEEIGPFYKPLGYEVCEDCMGASLKKGGKTVVMVITVTASQRVLNISVQLKG